MTKVNKEPGFSTIKVRHDRSTMLSYLNGVSDFKNGSL